MFTLNVPATENTVQQHAVETRPKATSEWLARLPHASPVDAAQQVVLALHSLNRLPLGTDERQALLSRYSPVVARIASSLELLLADSGVTPHAQQRQTGVVLRELLIEHSIGYKQLLLSLANRRFGRPSPKHTAEATSQLLATLRDIQAACFLTYTPPPPGLWLEMHQIYAFAQDSNLADQTTNGGLPPSLVYRQALLLALADPPHMSHAELAHTRLYLDHFGALAGLAPSPENHTAHGFPIQTDCDHGPGQWSPNPTSGHLWLDTETLCQHLFDTAVRLRTGDTPRRIGLPQGMESGLIQSLCKRLHKLWRPGMERAFKRYPALGSRVQVVAGVSAIHRLLELVPQTAELDPDPHDGLPNRDAKSIFSAPVAVNASHWTLNNDSAAGLSLRGAPDVPLNLKVGDALAMQSDDSAVWSLAVVRWIRMLDARQVELGVERLAPRIQPVWVQPLRGHRKANPEPGLFLPGLPALKQPDRLLLPRHIYQSNMDAEVWHTPREYSVTFGHRLEQTPSFDLIDFTVFSEKPHHD